MEFCGEDITRMSPLQLSRRGIAAPSRTLQVFGKLSVRDNLIVASAGVQRDAAGRLFAAPMPGWGRHADEMIELFRLQHVARLPAGSLSTAAEADRHRHGVHAFAAPGASRRALRGVIPRWSEQLRELLLEVNRTQGGSFIVIEHNMDFIMRLCPRVICMVEGRGTRRGQARAECRRIPPCWRLTLGASAARPADRVRERGRWLLPDVDDPERAQSRRPRGRDHAA